MEAEAVLLDIEQMVLVVDMAVVQISLTIIMLIYVVDNQVLQAQAEEEVS
jgi:hypothetical protein